MRPFPASSDVLVIGGGIAGASVAREARRRGLGVLLVERGDLACGTSSRSTKLLHGGLRYLEHGHLRLVRESLRERETTARLAPHLARPLAIAVPASRRLEALRVRVGVALYDVLAGRQPLGRGAWISPDDLHRAAPTLAEAGRGGVVFRDRQTDDARLTLAIARDAARRGAAVRTRADVVELLARDRRVSGARIRDGETGETHEVAAGVVVNAAGPWADAVRALAGLDRRALRPSRGTHVVLRDLGLANAVFLPGRRPRQHFFAIPWRGATLFGTTDDDHDGPPSLVAPTPGDLALLLDEARRHFPRVPLGSDAILSAFAGLRPLVREEGDTLAISREHRVAEERGLVSLLGGKLTTWRAMAEEVVDRVVDRLGRGARATPERDDEPLPGGGRGDPDPRWAESLPPDTQRSLFDLYGSEAAEVLSGAEPGGLARLDDGGPEILAQVDFAVKAEMALRLEDVVFRRLPIGHDPARVRSVAPAAAERMARLLAWGPERTAAEIREVVGLAAASEPVLGDAPSPLR